MSTSARTIRCLITAGPTREFFDPVRFLSNPSTGKMGFALAEAALAAGWSVDLVSGPVALPEIEHENLTFYPVVTGEEMFHQADALFDPCEVFIATAAVMDYRPVETSPTKLKKTRGNLTVELEPVVDILKTLAVRKRARQLLVGFAAETDHVERNARAKLTGKNCDLLVANDVTAPGAGFGTDTNTVQLYRAGEEAAEALGPASKHEIAAALIARFEEALAARA